MLAEARFGEGDAEAGARLFRRSAPSNLIRFLGEVSIDEGLLQGKRAFGTGVGVFHIV